MPTLPKNNKCEQLGCKNPRSRLNTLCLAHGGMDNLPARDTDSVYQTPLWRSIRATQLSKQPLCQGCLSRNQIVVAKHVDHLFAWKHIGKHAFSRNIFQSLCHECHSYKTGIEKQGIYRHYEKEGVKDYGKNDYGFLMTNV